MYVQGLIMLEGKTSSQLVSLHPPPPALLTLLVLQLGTVYYPVMVASL